MILNDMWKVVKQQPGQSNFTMRAGMSLKQANAFARKHRNMPCGSNNTKYWVVADKRLFPAMAWIRGIRQHSMF